MVIDLKTCLLTGLLGAACAASLSATPKLQLASTSLPQVTVSVGSNTTTQSVDAQNIGDGSLNLQLKSSASWLMPTLGSAHPCSSGNGASCLPIQIALQTSSLAAGTYAGLVLVYDPNAIDAFQTINVSVQVGSDVPPPKMDFSVFPGMTASAAINSPSTYNITVSDTDKWLTEAQTAGSPFSKTLTYTVTVSAGAMSVADYNGSLAVNPAGSNNSTTVPVTMHVVQQPISGPLSVVGGTVNNSTYAGGESLAQGDIVAMFGTQFISGMPAGATSLPLGTTLGNVQVLLNGTAVPMYYVSASQINFQIPYEAQIGNGTLQVVSNSTNGNITSVTIAKAVPRILRLNGNFGDYGIVVNASDNTLTLPTSENVGGHPSKAGQALTIYAIGLGPTSPAVVSGVGSPTSPLANATDNPMVCFLPPTPFDSKGLCVAPLFAGLTPGFVGLYQVNVVVPTGTPTGDAIPIFLQTNDGDTNQVNIAVQ